jgi:hypothetical protein
MTNIQLHQVNYSLSEISSSLGKAMALGIVILVAIYLTLLFLFFVSVAAMILGLILLGIILVSLNKWGANSNQKFVTHKQSSDLLKNSARVTSHQKIMFCWMMSKNRSTSISLLIRRNNRINYV